VATLNGFRRLLLAGLVGAGLFSPCIRATGATATEQQVKAVFVYNFSHFVGWSPTVFTSPTEPFVIGVFGSDAFTAILEDVVRGERVDDHPILVRRFRDIDAIGPCQILFIDRSENTRLEQIVAVLKGRGTLTVTDVDGATQRGAMIQLANVNSRIRLRVNIELARADGLVLSSNLLRSAEIVRTNIAD
jgi:hypothetical protein